jgi:hypothetical protein
MPVPPEIWIVERVDGIESIQFVIINLAVRGLIVAAHREQVREFGCRGCCNEEVRRLCCHHAGA